MASWRSTYHGLLPAELLANLSVEARTEQWARQIEESEATGRTCLYVAEDGHDAGSEFSARRIVGFASAGPEREPESGFDAELYAIYVLAKHQGTGVGRELVSLVASFLSDQGHTSMRVWVLAGNPAERCYQRLGGVRVEEKAIDIGGTEYREVAYGWRTLVGLSKLGLSSVGLGG